MVIDAHTHRYATYVINNPLDWSKKVKEAYWSRLVASSSIQAWADRRKMLADMDAAGVEKVVLLGWYWEHQSTCEEQLTWFLKWIKEDPERFIAFSPVQPACGEKAFDFVKLAMDRGCKGIGEVLPQVQAFDLNSNKVWKKISTWAEQNKLPINLHVTEPAGHKYEGRVETPLQSYVDYAESYPDLPIILAHWGGGLPFYCLNRFAKRVLKNVYYDTAASPLNYDSRVWKTVVDLVGADKILFGSDYPLKVYPRRQKEAEFSSILKEFVGAGLADADIKKISSRNIERLLVG